MKMKIRHMIMLLLVSCCLQGVMAQVKIGVDDICKVKAPAEKLQLLKRVEFHALSIPERDKIWQDVLHADVSTNSMEWLSFFSDMTTLVRYLMWQDDCVTNNVRLIDVADHLGRFQIVDVSFFDNEVKQAFEADRSLTSPDGKYRRRTGTHAQFGPHMLALKRRLSKANHWNDLVSKYRNDILSVVRDALVKSEPAHAETTKKMAKEFSERAKLTQAEEKIVLPGL